MPCALLFTGFSSCEKKAGERRSSEAGGSAGPADPSGAANPRDSSYGSVAPEPNPSVVFSSAGATGRGASSPLRTSSSNWPSSAARSCSSTLALEAQLASRSSSAAVTETICARCASSQFADSAASHEAYTLIPLCRYSARICGGRSLVELDPSRDAITGRGSSSSL